MYINVIKVSMFFNVISFSMILPKKKNQVNECNEQKLTSIALVVCACVLLHSVFVMI